jgi:hypothetical protein
MTRQICGALLVGGVLAACASQNAYVPEEHATTTLGGRTAASYALPSERDPRGNLRVASAGISKLKRNGVEVGKAIHVRIAISHRGGGSIALDARRQRLQLPDGRELAPAYLVSPRATSPVVSVPPGASRTIDLYFPMPSDWLSRRSPYRFDVAWRVWTANGEVSRVTPFDRVSFDPAMREHGSEGIVDVVPTDATLWSNP